MKNYQELFQKNNINSVESKRLLKRFGYTKIFKKIINTIFASLWIISLFSLFTASGKPDSGGAFAVLSFLTLFIYFPLLVAYLQSSNYYIGKLEQIYFDEFLCKKLKIFYTLAELDKFEYAILKETTVTANQNNNQRQALILICHQAYEEGAEGVLILSSDNSSITTGDIGKRGGSVKTELLGTVSARFISNIREKDNNKYDLTYWFGLFEKGAITKDEYEAKKRDLM